MEKLLDKGISTRPGTHAVHMLGYYSSKFKISPDDFPEAKTANDKSISLPIHNRMVKEDVKYIIHHLKNIN